MKIILNIYNGSNIVKTYESELESLSTWFCVKMFKGTDFENWFSKNDSESVEAMIKIILKNFDLYFDLFKSIFPDLTADEWDNTHMTEITSNVMLMLNYTIANLFKLGEASKN